MVDFMVMMFYAKLPCISVFFGQLLLLVQVDNNDS